MDPHGVYHVTMRHPNRFGFESMTSICGQFFFLFSGIHSRFTTLLFSHGEPHGPCILSPAFQTGLLFRREICASAPASPPAGGRPKPGIGNSGILPQSKSLLPVVGHDARLQHFLSHFARRGRRCIQSNRQCLFNGYGAWPGQHFTHQHWCHTWEPEDGPRE